MAKLSEVSKEMAQKLMEEVNFENRLIGVTMAGSTGNNDVTLYSLKELVFFLRNDSFEKLSNHRGHGSMCYVNIDDMLHWIGQVYGDQELATVMTSEMVQVESDIDKLEVAGELLRERMKQCVEALASDSKKVDE